MGMFYLNEMKNEKFPVFHKVFLSNLAYKLFPDLDLATFINLTTLSYIKEYINKTTWTNLA